MRYLTELLKLLTKKDIDTINIDSQLRNIKKIVEEKPLISINHLCIKKDYFNNYNSKYYINTLLKYIPENGFINIKPDFSYNNGNTVLDMYNNEYQQQNKYIYEKCIFDRSVSKIPIAP